MAKKLTATTKVDRTKLLAVRALKEIRENPNRQEVLGFVTTSLSQIFAILDSEKDDEFAITYLWMEIQKEVTGEKMVQPTLPQMLLEAPYAKKS